MNNRTYVVDYHVHIGQFEDVYYDAEAVFETIFAGGAVRSVHFSSTTSCVEGVRFSDVEKEIADSFGVLKKNNLGFMPPWLWWTPGYIKQGVNIEEVMDNILYFGFKLHPFADDWDFENKTHLDALHYIFNYVNCDGSMRIVIHTGESGRDSPKRFLPFFTKYPQANIILAHGRPVEETLEMMETFPNICCDTAFMPERSVHLIVHAGFADRIYTGSDFPITHYFTNRSVQGKDEISLVEQYKRDTAQMQKYKSIIERHKNAVPPEI